jgi:hypothetical protein
MAVLFVKNLIFVTFAHQFGPVAQLDTCLPAGREQQPSKLIL